MVQSFLTHFLQFPVQLSMCQHEAAHHCKYPAACRLQVNQGKTHLKSPKTGSLSGGRVGLDAPVKKKQRICFYCEGTCGFIKVVHTSTPMFLCCVLELLLALNVSGRAPPHRFEP